MQSFIHHRHVEAVVHVNFESSQQQASDTIMLQSALLSLVCLHLVAENGTLPLICKGNTTVQLRISCSLPTVYLIAKPMSGQVDQLTDRWSRPAAEGLAFPSSLLFSVRTCTLAHLTMSDKPLSLVHILFILQKGK